MQLQWSEACERNKGPILEVLEAELKAPLTVLEIGSGTGQHAVYFSQQLPHLRWQPSDQGEYLAGLCARVEQEGGDNLLPPVALDVLCASWPDEARRAEAVFSANTLHIMSWPAVVATFAGVGEVLAPGQWFLSYGPFSEEGRHNSDSNREFDAFLRQRDPASGIRDIRDLEALAAEHGLVLTRRWPMPANNRILGWQRLRSHA